MTPPIKSRHGLTRCPACGAHIEAAATPADTSCPFCGETLRFRGARRMPSGRGGLIAASLFALASASACGSAEEPDPETPPTDDPGPPDVEPAPPPDDVVPVPAYGVEPMPDDYDDTPADDPAGEDVYGAPPE